jgi:hypothetical protein
MRVIDAKLIETKLDLFPQNAVARYNLTGRGAWSILDSRIGEANRAGQEYSAVHNFRRNGASVVPTVLD